MPKRTCSNTTNGPIGQTLLTDRQRLYETVLKVRKLRLDSGEVGLIWSVRRCYPVSVAVNQFSEAVWVARSRTEGSGTLRKCFTIMHWLGEAQEFYRRAQRKWRELPEGHARAVRRRAEDHVKRGRQRAL